MDNTASSVFHRPANGLLNYKACKIGAVMNMFEVLAVPDAAKLTACLGRGGLHASTTLLKLRCVRSLGSLPFERAIARLMNPSLCCVSPVRL